MLVVKGKYGGDSDSSLVGREKSTVETVRKRGVENETNQEEGNRTLSRTLDMAC